MLVPMVIESSSRGESEAFWSRSSSITLSTFAASVVSISGRKLKLA